MSASEISVLVDKYILLREERLLKQREVDALAEQEQDLKTQIITDLQKNQVPVLGGQRGTVKLQQKIKPIVADWTKLYKYIKKNDAFDLLQKRLTETAVKLRWEEDVSIPGVETFTVYDLSISDRR